MTTEVGRRRWQGFRFAIAAGTFLLLITTGVPTATAQLGTRTLSGPADAVADSVALDRSTVAAGADSLAAPADSLLAGAVADTLPIPTAAAVEPIDLWNTGASPAGAVLMSPLFPGWGQLYTENNWRAALAYGSQMWFWSRMLTRDRRAVRAREFAATFEVDSVNYNGYNAIAEENWEQMRDFAWWSGAAMFIIALDAYVGAHLFHFDDDPVPVPNRWDDIFDRPGGRMPGSIDAPSVVVMRWGTRF